MVTCLIGTKVLVSLGSLITPMVTYAVRPVLLTRRLFVQNDTCKEEREYMNKEKTPSIIDEVLLAEAIAHGIIDSDLLRQQVEMAKRKEVLS